MKTLRNLSSQPLRITLPHGKMLHLAPGRTGQIADRDVDRDSVQCLLEAGAIEIVGESLHGPFAGEATPTEQASTHGHPQPSRATVSGNR